MENFITFAIIIGIPFVSLLLFRQAGMLNNTPINSIPQYIAPAIFLMTVITFSINIPTTQNHSTPTKKEAIDIPKRLLDHQRWMEPYYNYPYQAEKAHDAKGSYREHLTTMGFDRLLVVFISFSNHNSAVIDLTQKNDFPIAKTTTNYREKRDVELQNALYVDIAPDRRWLSKSANDMKSFANEPFSWIKGNLSIPKESLAHYNFNNESSYYRCGDLYMIPFSSKEEMVAVSDMHLRKIISPSWIFAERNIGWQADIYMKQLKNLVKSLNSQAISPLWLSWDNWLLFTFITLIIFFLSKRNFPLSLILSVTLIPAWTYFGEKGKVEANTDTLISSHHLTETQQNDALKALLQVKFFQPEVRALLKKGLLKAKLTGPTEQASALFLHNFLYGNPFGKKIETNQTNMDDFCELSFLYDGHKFKCYLLYDEIAFYQRSRNGSSQSTTYSVSHLDNNICQSVIRSFQKKPKHKIYILSLSDLKPYPLAHEKIPTGKLNSFLHREYKKIRHAQLQGDIKNAQ